MDLSILIPTYNRLSYLKEALQSVKHAYPFTVEILVSDNRSQDGTREFLQNLQSPETKVLLQAENLGMVGNWNALLSAAKGRYIYLLCDDDICLPPVLTSLVQEMEKNPELVIASGARREMTTEQMRALVNTSRERPAASSKKRVLTSEAVFQEMCLKENIMGGPSCVLFRREFLERFPAYRYAADWAAWIEIAGKGTSLFSEELLCYFRLHEKSLTQAFVADHTDFWETAKLRKKSLLELEKRAGPQPLLRIRVQALFLYRFVRRCLRLLLQGKIRELAAFKISFLQKCAEL